MPGKTAVFIDNGYFRKIQENFRIRVCYRKFSNEIVGSDKERFRTYVYDCPPYQSNPATSEESRLKSWFDSFKYNITRLPRFGFRVGRLQLVRDQKGKILRMSIIELCASPA